MDNYRVTLRKLTQPNRVVVKMLSARSLEDAGTKVALAHYGQCRRWRAKYRDVTADVQRFDAGGRGYVNVRELRIGARTSGRGYPHGEG